MKAWLEYNSLNWDSMCGRYFVTPKASRFIFLSVMNFNVRTRLFNSTILPLYCLPYVSLVYCFKSLAVSRAVWIAASVTFSCAINGVICDST